ncbi:addiction module antitoxin RelB [Spirochaetia bacterium]|nr:addiction module antitoxin RelB [Spirochaetia bacterium]GHU36211.1 addiction module antitoxin RelB [Spirochaetia bacterium]
MKNIRRTDVYKKWFENLNDARAKASIYARVIRLAQDNPGDWAPIGEGLFELRIHYGPGYRVYYKDTGKEIVLLLCGGDKSTQDKDIARAKAIFKDYKLGNEKED